MSSFQHSDNSSDGDWEEKGDLAWNEFDWKRYLKHNEDEVSRFLTLYNKMRQHPNRLDEIAHIMGWDKEDWNAGDYASMDERDAFELDLFNESDSHDSNEAPEPEEWDPYTIHRHPIYIVTRALYKHLNEKFLRLIEDHHVPIPTIDAMQFSASLNRAEHDATLAVSALDMGDFNLCVCHLKRSLQSLNTSLSSMQHFPSVDYKACAYYAADATAILFDLRELWLRVMSECREEHRRGFGS